MRDIRQSSRATTAGNILRSRGLVVSIARCMHVHVFVRRYQTLVELKVEKSGLLTEKFRVITSRPVICGKAWISRHAENIYVFSENVWWFGILEYAVLGVSLNFCNCHHRRKTWLTPTNTENSPLCLGRERLVLFACKLALNCLVTRKADQFDNFGDKIVAELHSRRM